MGISEKLSNSNKGDFVWKGKRELGNETGESGKFTLSE